MTKLIDVLKLIWSNKRYKALFILGLYFLFFLIIFLIIIFSKPHKTEETIIKTTLDQYKETVNYTFKISVDNDVILGQKQNSMITFKYHDIEYTYNADILNPNDFIYEEIVKYMDNIYIYNLIKDKDIESKTEYKDSSISKTYLIDNIEITTYETDIIYEVDIKINDKLYKISY